MSDDGKSTAAVESQELGQVHVQEQAVAKECEKSYGARPAHRRCCLGQTVHCQAEVRDSVRSSSWATLSERGSYRQLGLMATPNPRLSGGLEPLPVVPFVYQQQTAPEASTSALPAASTSASATAAASGKIPKGFARVERDAEGNIVNVTFAEEDEAEAAVEEVEACPWGEAFPDGDVGDAAVEIMELEEDAGLDRTQGIPMPIETEAGIRIPKLPKQEPTAVVKGPSLFLTCAGPAETQRTELERIAANQRPAEQRFTSDRELEWLSNLAKKHSGDVSAMVRDIKGNPLQRTDGALSQSLSCFILTISTRPNPKGDQEGRRHRNSFAIRSL